MATLPKTKRGSLKKMIMQRLEKRVRNYGDRDGYQTPYIKHVIDVASHSMAVCCRGCISRWYGFEKKNLLSDQQMHHLYKIVITYLLWVLKSTKLRTWMTEIEHKQKEPYYIPGIYNNFVLVDDTPIDQGQNWQEFKRSGIKEIW